MEWFERDFGAFMGFLGDVLEWVKEIGIEPEAIENAIKKAEIETQ